MRKTGAIHQALLGLMAGRLADEIRVDLDIFEIHYRSTISLRLTDVQRCYSSTSAFKLFSSAKVSCEVVFRSAKNWEAWSIPTIKYYCT